MDADRRLWLEKVAAACERILERRTTDNADARNAALLEDVAALLARIRAELGDGR